MKRAVIILSSLTVMGLPATTPAQTTGKEAMRTVGRERGADYLPRMLHLVGERGTDQPAVWRVIARDGRGAVREFFVSRGVILTEGIVPPASANGISATPLPMHRLNIDSNVAFEKAELAARTAKVGFDNVNYQLRCLELSSNAAWFVTLVDEKGLKVGEICVGASTGNLVSQTFYPKPIPIAGTVSGPQASSISPQQPNVWDKAKKGINRGAEGVKTGVTNTFGWIRRKVAPQPRPSTSPYYIPPAR